MDFTKGNLFVKLVKFMLPIFVALALQAMYSAVDLLIVGQFGTTEGMSGVSTGCELINLFMFSICGFTGGVTVLMGKYIGEKKEGNVARVLGAGICFFSIISIILTILLVSFARPIAILLNAPKEALEETVIYIRICGAGTIFTTAYNFISAIFRGVGDSKRPLMFISIACIVNIFADLLLIGVFKLNVIGAAIATIFAQAVSVVLSLLIIKKEKLTFGLTRKDIIFNEEMRNILSVGFPLALQEILTQISFICIVAFINDLGLSCSSGYGIACRIISIAMLVSSTLIQSMTSLIAQNYGAKLESRCKQVLVDGMIIGGSIGIVLSIACFFFGSELASVFTKDSEVILKAAEFLKGFAIESFLTAILFSFNGYFCGHEMTKVEMINSIICSFLIRLPFSYFMSIQENPSMTNIGFAYPLASIFGILINLIVYIIYINKQKRV